MATIQLTGKVVAVKKIAQDKSVKNRELQIMKELHHQNIIRIQHGFFTSTWEGLDNRVTKLNIVMDFIPGTISRVQEEFAKLN